MLTAAIGATRDVDSNATDFGETLFFETIANGLGQPT